MSALTLNTLASKLSQDLSPLPEIATEPTVRCALGRDKLMVLAEYPAAPTDTILSQAFAQLEQRLRHQLNISGLPEEAAELAASTDKIPVHLYFKLRDQEKPLAVHRFVWQVSEGFDAVFGDAAALPPETYSETYPPLDTTPFDPEPADSEAVPEEEIADLQPADTDRWEAELTENIAIAASLDEEPEVATVDEAEVQQQGRPWQQRTLHTRWLAIGLAGGVILVGGLYGATRPCTFGRCERIETAQVSGAAALDQLESAPSPGTIQDVRQDLRGVVNRLRPIPFWSPYHDQAQAVIQNYQAEIDRLDTIVAAQGSAIAAAELAQSPPHPIERWQEIAAHWRDAIQRLESVSPESAVYAFAETKLTEYRNYLAIIEGRIASEEAAEASNNQALQAAQLGTQLAEIADSLEEWETALSSWQTAVSRLEQIPQGTLAYGEAQELLPQYEASLGQVRTQTRRERIADQFFYEAVGNAAEARRYEGDEQWTLAVMNWRDALQQARRVPENTAQYEKTQNLISTYQKALSEAEANLQIAARFQTAQPSLASACGFGNQQRCAFRIQDGKVRLDLVQGYDQALNQSITPPPERQATAISPQVAAEANELLRQITAIGDNNRLPLELYDAGGEFLARYRPELDGFVR
ncbi:hypothetical protein IQ241_24940 [Romeria aff. gracilis LEGE 07310]|uniref:Uncharacterized protein n=1 Tax=Vasconcelosia minhoensis LEGE 07310 TaxID=915328 RepID=A0A8J7AM28_9CYAN|nr:hypothetical protein [Romeria gracilis]MBE9080488.1 hypothetical protein [Romeria aff. gracilis LEGE 07310]